MKPKSAFKGLLAAVLGGAVTALFQYVQQNGIVLN